MKKIISIILIATLVLSFITVSASVGIGAITDFSLNNLTGSLSFTYENTYYCNHDIAVLIKNKTTGTVEYCNQITSGSNGKLNLSGIQVHESGIYLLTVCPLNSEYSVSHEFTFLSSSDTVTYPNVTVQMLEEDLAGTALGGHPYLFGRNDDFARVRSLAFGGNEFITKQYQGVKNQAMNYIGIAPVPISGDLSKTSYISRGFNAWKIVMLCAFVYLMEGNTQFADRAYAEAEYFADMPTWGTYQSLDNNQAAFTVALCYDWLYNYLNADQRTKLKSALKTKHLDIVLGAFRDPSAPQYNSSFYRFYFSNNNHAVLDNTSVFVEALAIADTADDFSYCAELMSDTLLHLEPCFDNLYPDSAWYEGVGYWSFVGPFIGRMLSSMESAFGKWYGYENIPSIVNCSDFPVYAQSSIGSFKFGDIADYRDNSIEKFYFGKIKNDRALQRFVLKDGYPADSPLLCLWYEPGIDYDSENIILSKDKLFRNINMAVMRNTWYGSQETYCGMKVSKASDTHANMDSGTFVLDALGERWITNPGEDSYKLYEYWDSTQNGYRWNYYPKRAEANSCLVINPSASGGQYVDSEDTIDVFETGASEAYAISDLTETYRDYVSSYKRGVKLYDNRTKFLVQDEVVMTSPSEAYSFINIYKADIKIAADGCSAVISKGNKKLYMKVLCNRNYTMSVMEAFPLPTSPAVTEGEIDYTDDYQRIAIHFDGVSDFNLTVIFIPYLDNAELTDVSASVIPFSYWSIDNSEYNLPMLSSLKINGEDIEGFEPNNRCYKIYSESPNVNVQPSADGRYNVSVTHDTNTNCYKVMLTDINDSSNVNVYMVYVFLKGQITADAYVGGSITGDTTFINMNYGGEPQVKLVDGGKYSVIAYYKVKLPPIPSGKTIKSVTLKLQQYRIKGSGYNYSDPLCFYSVQPDSWQENVITYNNAPLRHTYDVNWYPFYIKDSNGEYTIEAQESLRITKDLTSALLQNRTPSESFYAPEEYDITKLVNDVNFSDITSSDNEISFVIAIPNSETRSCSTHYIASKENTNENLRPMIYVELDENLFTVTEPKIVSGTLNTEGLSYNQCVEVSSINAGDRIKAVSNISNNTGNSGLAKFIIAGYKSNRLCSVSIKDCNITDGSNVLIESNSLTISQGTEKIIVFIWDSELKPYITYKEKVCN